MLFRFEPHSRRTGEFDEPEVGLQFFIEQESEAYYNVKFLD